MAAGRWGWRWAVVAGLVAVMGCGDSTGGTGSLPDAEVGPGLDTSSDATFGETSVGGPDADAGPTADVAPEVDTVPPADVVADTPTINPDDPDNDGVPNAADPFPADPNRPGIADDFVVYAHTASTLFTMNVKTYQVTPIGDFQFPTGFGTDEEMTDIAIDRWGVLWGISFDRLWVCHPQTVQCWLQGELPASFNGLTWVPGPAISAGSDILIGVSGAGDWFHLQPQGVSVSGTKLGSYGPNYSSSGDAFSIEGIGTFASVNEAGKSDDRIVRLDPKTGAIIALVGTTPGLDELWGMAGWTERIFGFDASGDIVVLGLLDGAVTPITSTGHAWWGAGVRSRL